MPRDAPRVTAMAAIVVCGFLPNGLLHLHVARPRQRLDMHAETTVGGAGELLQAGKFEAGAGRQRSAHA